MDNTVKCPQCGQEIAVGEALTQKIEADLEKKLSAKLLKQAEDKVRAESDSEKNELINKIKLQQEKLQQTQEEELKLRQEKYLLEEERRSFELNKQRQLDTERDIIRQKTLVEASESHRLKDLEKDKVINDLKRSLEDAQLKASQGSQQLQGEVQELDLEDYLKHTYPTDEINPVGKGVKGADISQVVKTSKGTICGVILWESKRTKAWMGDWTSKLKDDLRASQANIPVIISTIMPKEIKTGFGYFEGVWVAEPIFIPPLADILRKNLIDIAREKFNGKDRGTKADMIYSYLTSDSFIQQIQSIIEVHQSIQLQIQKERSAFEKIWKERESQAGRIIMSTAGIYGSIQGIAGQSLPTVRGFELLESGE